MNLAPIADAAVMAAAGLVGALATALLAVLPRLWTLMKVSINGADNTLLRNAIGSAARRAVVEIDGGRPTEIAIAAMADYVTDNLPSAVARLKVPEATLLTMCAGELARVMAGRG